MTCEHCRENQDPFPEELRMCLSKDEDAPPPGPFDDFRVLISLITLNDLVFTETVKSILSLDLDGIDHEFHWVQHSITAAARNCSAAKAVGEGFTHLLFLDMDMTFHPQTVKRLLKHDVDIVSGMYRARRGDPSPFFAFNFDAVTGVPKSLGCIDMTGPELLKVDGLPTGCLLIKSDVFRKLDEQAFTNGDKGPAAGQPYFWYESRMDRLQHRTPLIVATHDTVSLEEQIQNSAALTVGNVSDDVLRYKPAFGRGEDLRFCASCKDADVNLYVDTRLVCGHLAMQAHGTAALYE